MTAPERERDWADERAEPMTSKEWLTRWAKIEGLDPERIVEVYEPYLDTLIDTHARQARRDGAIAALEKASEREHDCFSDRGECRLFHPIRSEIARLQAGGAV